jgi:hypothetical protein
MARRHMTKVYSPAIGAPILGHPVIAPLSCLLHGIDTLEVSYFFDTSVSGLDFGQLYLAKVGAAEAKRNRWTEIRLGSQDFFVLPHGAQRYGIVLKNSDFTIRLGERMSPNCCVKFSSEGLWRNGTAQQLHAIDDWARSIGLVSIHPPVIGRADWATDFYVPEPDFDLDHFVSKAKKDRVWRSDRRAQSFTFGKGALVIRVYDKSAEIREQSDKAWFHELWGCSDHVWRTEFQARGPYLKMHGIRTPDDLLELQYDAQRHAASTHTTLRCPGSDSNRSRWPHHPMWRALLGVIETGNQHGLIRSFDPVNSDKWRLFQQLKSLAGYVKGVAALDTTIQGLAEPPDLKDFLARRLPQLLTKQVDPQDWRDDVRAKINCHRMGHR